MTPADLHKFADRLENLYALGAAEANGIAAIRAIADARLDTGWATPEIIAGDVRAAGLVYDPQLDRIEQGDGYCAIVPNERRTGGRVNPASHVPAWNEPPESFVPWDGQRPYPVPPFDPSPVFREASMSWHVPTGSFRADIANELMHQAHQQNDEMACRCGKRWPVGEEHP